MGNATKVVGHIDVGDTEWSERLDLRIVAGGYPLRG
jgi:hypothetical protein